MPDDLAAEVERLTAELRRLRIEYRRVCAELDHRDETIRVYRRVIEQLA